jgi:hypothetical protein
LSSRAQSRDLLSLLCRSYDPHPRRLSPFGRQIFPPRILSLDQHDLFPASPSLQLLFSLDCGLHPLELFVVNQAIHLVFGCEASVDTAAMFANASPEVTRDSDVEDSGLRPIIAASRGEDSDADHAFDCHPERSREPTWSSRKTRCHPERSRGTCCFVAGIGSQSGVGLDAVRTPPAGNTAMRLTEQQVPPLTR